MFVFSRVDDAGDGGNVGTGPGNWRIVRIGYFCGNEIEQFKLAKRIA